MCKKKPYRDELAAKLALSELHWKDKPMHFENRIYKCRECRYWHLTSGKIGKRKKSR